MLGAELLRSEAGRDASALFDLALLPTRLRREVAVSKTCCRPSRKSYRADTQVKFSGALVPFATPLPCPV
jgi:hypothetical protein